MNPILIRVGFKTTCWPAGEAECNITGTMDVDSIQDVIQMLAITIGRLRRQIEQGVGEQMDNKIEEYRQAVEVSGISEA
jgi:hypothetical protein